jgi:hypothetical protein
LAAAGAVIAICNDRMQIVGRGQTSFRTTAMSSGASLCRRCRANCVPSITICSATVAASDAPATPTNRHPRQRRPHRADRFRHRPPRPIPFASPFGRGSELSSGEGIRTCTLWEASPTPIDDRLLTHAAPIAASPIPQAHDRSPHLLCTFVLRGSVATTTFVLASKWAVLLAGILSRLEPIAHPGKLQTILSK